MHTDRILVLTENLPMKVEFIETPRRWKNFSRSCMKWQARA